MKKINGNINAVLKISTTSMNDIGESVPLWDDSISITGFLSFQNGDSPYQNFNAKIEESTHVFLCEYNPNIYALADRNTRLVCKGHFYDVLVIDNPDERNEQLEIYLRYIGGQNE
jgi:hypothetical protein